MNNVFKLRKTTFKLISPTIISQLLITSTLVLVTAHEPV